MNLSGDCKRGRDSVSSEGNSHPMNRISRLVLGALGYLETCTDNKIRIMNPATSTCDREGRRSTVAPPSPPNRHAAILQGRWNIALPVLLLVAALATAQAAPINSPPPPLKALLANPPTRKGDASPSPHIPQVAGIVGIVER